MRVQGSGVRRLQELGGFNSYGCRVDHWSKAGPENLSCRRRFRHMSESDQSKALNINSHRHCVPGCCIFSCGTKNLQALQASPSDDCVSGPDSPMVSPASQEQARIENSFGLTLVFLVLSLLRVVASAVAGVGGGGGGGGGGVEANSITRLKLTLSDCWLY